ncbi:hypothetical protein STEG23_010566, partial [Scotinomys teguina]
MQRPDRNCEDNVSAVTAVTVSFALQKLLMEYYAAEKNNDIMKFAGKWMELENVILSEVGKETCLPERNLAFTELGRSPTPFSFVDCNTLLSLGLAPIPVCSTPQQ